MGNAKWPPPVSLLRDVPSKLEDDAFAHTTYVAVLDESLRNAKRPLTVGLFGPWGVGKSSILERLRKTLPQSECAFVLFDAWRYDGETLRRHLLRETVDQLRDKELIGPSFVPDKRMKELDVDRQTTRMRFDKSWVNVLPGAVGAIVTFLVVLGALQVREINEALFGAKPENAALISAITALIVLVVNLAAQSIRLVPETTTHRRLEDPERFHELFKDLIVALKRNRLILAIDNLDRCSAERVVEVLGTIKTYLEPAVEDATDEKHVLFVIAVDDDALRRHMLAQEISGGEPDVAKASRNVDEYLRKVFNASVRIAPFLHSDLRDYLTARIEEVGGGLALSDQQKRELASLTHAALRTNPRRTIQFLNNLQLRLRLIRERELGKDPLIHPSISEHPLVVAKLALLEEEWPRHFAALLDHPHMLSEWAERARAAEDLKWLGALDSTLRAEWMTLAPFLRVTAEIAAPNLRGYLRYKQSREERALPGYDDFRAAAVSGGREDVERMVAGSEAPADDFANALVRILGEELESGSASGARSVLEIALTVARVAAIDGLQRRLLKAAVDVPSFRQELAAMPPEPLLAAAQDMSPVDRGYVVDAVLSALTAREAGQVLAAAAALAPRLSWLPDGNVRVARLLAAPDLPERLRVVDLLTTADATLMTNEVATAVVEPVKGNPALLAGSERTLVSTVFNRALEMQRDPAVHEEVLDAVARAVPAVLADPVQGERALDDLLGLAVNAAAAPPHSRAAFASAVLPGVRGTSESRRPVLLARLLDVVTAAGGRSAEVREELLAILFESPGDGVTWAESQWETLDAESRRTVADLAFEAAIKQPEWRDAISLTGRADPEGLQERIKKAVIEGVEQGASPDEIVWLGPHLSPATRDELAGTLVDRAAASGEWPTAARLLELVAGLGSADRAVGGLTDRIERSSEPVEVVDAAGFANRLGVRFSEPDAKLTVMAALRQRLEQPLAPPAEREAFVLRVLDAALQHGDGEARDEALGLVRSLADDMPNVRKRLEEVSG